MRKDFSWLAVAITLMTVASSARAESVAEFYKGKRITIVVGSAAGGGYDVYARLLARHIGRHIPSEPNIIVQNMPGGGGLTAANHVYNVAARDGTAIGGLQRGLIIAPLIAPATVKYDVRKLGWLGSTTAETGVVAVWHTAPHKTIHDVLTQELILGGSGPATDAETLPRVYNKAIGTRFRIVSGYKSTNPILLAMERGEVQGIGNSSWSNWKAGFAHYLNDKKVRILLQAGLQKNPELGDVPHVMELVKTTEGRQMLELFLAPHKIGRPFATPPGLPTDRLAALRVAFDATLKDPELLADAAKSKLDISPVNGNYIEQTLIRVFATPQAVIQSAKDAIEAK